MQPKYKLIIKTDTGFETKEVSGLNFFTINGLPVVSATYQSKEASEGVPAENTTVIIDEIVNHLYQSTNTFDSKNNPIYHGDLLKEGDTLYEVMYAVGSYFIVKDEEALMLLDKVTRHMERVGNVIENYDLINVDLTALEEVAQKV